MVVYKLGRGPAQAQGVNIQNADNPTEKNNCRSALDESRNASTWFYFVQAGRLTLSQVNKEKYLQKEHAKQSRHISKQTSRGRKWMGGSVAGTYMLSMDPRPAPFFEDENIWKKELLKHEQTRNQNEPVHLERMRTVDLISLRRKTEQVDPALLLVSFNL